MRLRDVALWGIMAAVAAPEAFAQGTRLSEPPKPAATRAKAPAARGAAASAPAAPVSSGPRTLQEALAATYANNPALQAARAKLRATDEGVPQALSGWRPSFVLSGSGGYADGVIRSINNPPGPNNAQGTKRSAARDVWTAQAGVSQPVFNGGRTVASTRAAENKVMAERARLIAAEQQAFSDTVNAYVGVIQATQILALNVNNEQVLARQLRATQDRFRVGEITRTDVAQAEAAYAVARAERQTSEGSLQVARAAYTRVVGMEPGDLVPPQPLVPPVKSMQDAKATAAANNPVVVAALFDDASAKDAVDVAWSALMPQLSVQAFAFSQNNNTTPHLSTTGGQFMANLSIPLYQGGAEYAAVRQARQAQQQSRKLVEEARRAAIQQAAQAWETLVSARATVESTRAAIRANRIALDGVTREALVGSRTTLDVLNAQQAVLGSEVTLVRNLASLVTASHSVASALGRLTARDLHVAVPLYDEKAYYNAVRDRWAGTGDYATEQPGR